MKVVILAGGLGTRISEESHLKPKPMIEIGEKPILWHIMKEYSHYGFNEFIICAGYKQHMIKEWFADYYLHTSDVTFDFSAGNKMIVHNNVSEPWKVTIVDTGLNTMTGGRVKRIEKYIDGDTFFLTYGDAVSDVDIRKLYDFHRHHGKSVTLTTVSLAQQKGILEIGANNQVLSFREKEGQDSALINGGYMVCNRKIFSYLSGDDTVLEKQPMNQLAQDGELMSYYHKGFWQCMDTLRDHQLLSRLWDSGERPWTK